MQFSSTKGLSFYKILSKTFQKQGNMLIGRKACRHWGCIHFGIGTTILSPKTQEHNSCQSGNKNEQYNNNILELI